MTTQRRIVGLDVARALAIFGMIFVNFKVVLAGDGGKGWMWDIAGLFEGKAAATFVVLAGVGITLMFSRHIENNDKTRIKKAKTILLKRALFLFVVGLLYIPLWSGDILHFYGVYIVFAVLLLRASDRTLLLTAFGSMFIFIVLLFLVDYETGWNWETIEYAGFWTPVGFIRNLFYNGFHPVFPWMGFLLFGMWLGRRRLAEPKTENKILMISIIVFAVINIISYSILYLSPTYIDLGIVKDDLVYLVGTSPMPPLPLYLFAGASFATATIIICIKLARKFADSFAIKALADTGRLALTFYVAHVVIGMGVLFVLDYLEGHSLLFATIYTLIFSILSVIFAIIWRKRFKTGPLEWLMRKVTG